MEAFLSRTKGNQKTLHDFKHVHVVLGNEACDLDSAVSALVYAYFLHATFPKDEEETAFIPVLNIPSSDYRLRTEVSFALDRHGLREELLTFRDQLDLSQLQCAGKLRLTLVDHHVLPEADRHLDDALCEVLDHRKLDRAAKDGVSLRVEMVGSCCTLVADKALHTPAMSLPYEARQLLYMCILLDTVCLSESAGRTTSLDERIIALLEEALPGIDRQDTFNTIQAAKFDVSRLSTIDVLRKDLKVVSSPNLRIAMSSVPIHIKDFLARDDLLVSLEDFVRQQGAEAVIIMALHVDHQGEPHRQLAIYSADQQMRDQITRHVDQSRNPELGLSPHPSPHPGLSAFRQDNVKASRKHVMPLVKEWLQTQPLLKQEL